MVLGIQGARLLKCCVLVESLLRELLAVQENEQAVTTRTGSRAGRLVTSVRSRCKACPGTLALGCGGHGTCLSYAGPEA